MNLDLKSVAVCFLSQLAAFWLSPNSLINLDDVKIWGVRLPPKAVKTIQDLIFWQYAKIISESAGYGKKQFGFVMDRFKKLSSGEISWSSSIREYVKEREKKTNVFTVEKKTT